MVVQTDHDGSCLLLPEGGSAPEAQTIWMQPVTDDRREKLRLHLDLRPGNGDVESEIDRLVSLGATRADVGQTGEEGFTVLADPEGNEFCVLHGDPR
jgi:hypothetical protein